MIANHGYSSRVNYLQHLLFPIGVSTIFYVHDTWNIIEDFLVSRKLTALSCFLFDVNSFFHAITIANSPYRKKFEAIRKHALDFTNQKSHELLGNLLA